MKKLNIKNIDFEALKRERFEQNSKNPNNLSFWFDKIKDCGFKIPETHIIPMTFEMFKWLISDKYTEEAIVDFRNNIINSLRVNDFNTERTLFLKTGTFSDKFDFYNCKLTDLQQIGHQFLNIYYTSMILGADNTNELIVREFVSAKKERKTIYRGMPLNTEFRVFYDFDKKKILGSFNYWDKDTMVKGLIGYPVEEIQNFIEVIPTIEQEFKDYKDKLSIEVLEKLKNIDLKGKWSIDFMLIDGEFYLIDMALAHQSYYYDRLNIS